MKTRIFAFLILMFVASLGWAETDNNPPNPAEIPVPPAGTTVVTHSSSFTDTSLDDNDKISLSISNSVPEQINDIAITTNYIIAIAEGTNTKYGKKFCYVMVFDKSGAQLSKAFRDANDATIDYKCSAVVVEGETAYVIGEYEKSGTTYKSAVWKYSITSGILTFQTETFGSSYAVTTDPLKINDGEIVGGYLFLAGRHNDDFYLERWTIPAATYSANFHYDIYLSSKLDEVKKILKKSTGKGFYLVGSAKSNETMAINSFNLSGSNVVAVTDYGNYAAPATLTFVYLKDYSNGTYSHLPNTNYYLEDAYLDSDGTVVVTGRSTSGTTSLTHQIFMERIKSDGTGLESSEFIEIAAAEEAGQAIVVHEGLVYVASSLYANGNPSDTDSNFATWRFFADDKLDGSYGTDGFSTMDFHGGLDWVYASALDGNKLYLGGSVQKTDGTFILGLGQVILETPAVIEEPAPTSESETPGCTASATTETSCFDGIDNDCDGAIDCTDTECATSTFCNTITKETECSDGKDNEADGLVDCDDNDCAFNSACIVIAVDGSAVINTKTDTSTNTDTDVDDADTDTGNSAIGSGGCNCSFAATSPQNFNGLNFLVVMTALALTLMVRKYCQKNNSGKA